MRKYAALIILVQLIFGICFVSPYVQFRDEQIQNLKLVDEKSNLQIQLDDKAPKLHGFINRYMVADEPGTTNSLIFLEATIGNSGASPSLADDYSLKVNLTNNSETNAEEIYFNDEYKIDFWDKGKLYLLDLKRPELISEKTHIAIQPGYSPRGWIAFRLNGIPMSRYQPTNLILSFLDINDKKISVTNREARDKTSEETNVDALNMIFPGSDNIFSPVPTEINTNTAWLPPELPPGCSNVIVFFGANGMNYSRLAAEISPEGTKFEVKDLPDFYLQNLDKMPGYSPRMKYLWIKESPAYSIGGKIVPYPVQPIIISNRLYVEVEIPFLNEKRKIVMSDDFDPDLPIPPKWDRNFSTNYYANGIVSGGIYVYEVVNELTNPILQVAYAAPNVVFINGIFKVDENSILEAFGTNQPMLLTFTNRVSAGLESTQRITTVSLEGTNFSEILQIYTNDSIGSIGEMMTNEFYRPMFPGQRAIFKYPSDRNLGVFNDETNQ